MTTVRAPTRRFEQRKSAIIVSAVDVLNRKGVRGMTLVDVATQLGLVPTGVIYYFRNKEELAAACFLDSVDRYNALAAQAAHGAWPRHRPKQQSQRRRLRHLRQTAQAPHRGPAPRQQPRRQ